MSQRFRHAYISIVCVLLPLAIHGRGRADVGDLVLSRGATFGAAGVDLSGSIAADAAGNMYTTGTFRGTADFDPGPGVFQLTSAGDSDIYVCMFSPTGELRWAQSMGGAYADEGLGIGVDSSGAVYCTGRYRGTANFDPGGTEFTLPTNGSSSIYVCKRTGTGGFVWAGSMGGLYDDEIRGFTVDGAGNSIATGFFFVSGDFDPGPGIQTLSTAGQLSVFVCKINAAGALQWARALGGDFEDRAFSVATDGLGNVITTGNFEGVADFDPGPGTLALTSLGLGDLFVSKLDASGNLVWAFGTGNVSSDLGAAVAADDAGNVYYAGRYSGTVDFDFGAGVQQLNSASDGGVFISKLDPTGTLLWVRAVRATYPTFVYGAAIDSTGNFYVTGSFPNMFRFTSGADTYERSSAGGRDAYICKLDSSGAFQWAGILGGPGDDLGVALASDGSGNVYATGNFVLTADLDPGEDTYEVISAGQDDIYISKLEPQQPPVAVADAGLTEADQLLALVNNPATSSVLANDHDLNVRAYLTVSAFDATSALGALVSVNPDGTFVYDPTGVAAFQVLAPGDSMVDTFTYTISDGLDSAVGSVSITVNGKGTELPATNGWAMAAAVFVLALAGSAVMLRRDVPVRRPPSR